MSVYPGIYLRNLFNTRKALALLYKLSRALMITFTGFPAIMRVLSVLV